MNVQQALQSDGYFASMFQPSVPSAVEPAMAVHRKKTLPTGFDLKAAHQNLPTHDETHYEGATISASGEILAVASGQADEVYLFRRTPTGIFSPTPYCAIGGIGAAFEFPHDVAFATIEGVEILAVIERRGVISLFRPEPSTMMYSSQPIFKIKGDDAGLTTFDGVSFVGPNGAYLAASNLAHDTVTFYQRLSGQGLTYGQTPVHEMHHQRLFRPDGLGFSPCGAWLAVANYGENSVAIYRRGAGFPGYDTRPVQVIRGVLAHPHSVAFTPDSQHMLVTNAGANSASVFEFKSGWFGPRWVKSSRSVSEFALPI